MTVKPGELLVAAIRTRAARLRQRVMQRTKAALKKRRAKNGKHEPSANGVVQQQTEAPQNEMAPISAAQEPEVEELSVCEELRVPNGSTHTSESLENGADSELISNRETDTSESDEDDTPTTCSCADHAGLAQLDCIYNFSLRELRDLILTNSTFFSDFSRSRKWKEIKHTEWALPDVAGASSHCRRQLSYSLPTNTPLAPKTCSSVENMEELEVLPDAVLVVESTVTNTGVPYADYFNIINRYCLTRAGATRCRLRITTRITYKKSVWGLIKSFIDKSILQGVKQHFSAMDEALQAAGSNLTSHPVRKAGAAVDASSARALRRRARARTLSNTQASPLATQEVPATGDTIRAYHVPVRGVEAAEVDMLPNRHVFIALCVMLALLLLLNVHLYWRVCSLENTLLTQSTQSTRPSSSVHRPETGEGDASHLHLKEQRWQLLVDTTIHLLDQMRTSLTAISNSVQETQDAPTP